MTFRAELESLVNRYSQENGSNTPDHILAEYLTNCLCAFDDAVNMRERWYGREGGWRAQCQPRDVEWKPAPIGDGSLMSVVK